MLTKWHSSKYWPREQMLAHAASCLQKRQCLDILTALDCIASKHVASTCKKEKSSEALISTISMLGLVGELTTSEA